MSTVFGKGYANTYDAFIIPFPDVEGTSLPAIIGKAATGLGALAIGVGMGLTGIQQLEVDKGNVITAHRVDGGYALTQRGGKHDDRVFIRVLLTGAFRFWAREWLSYYADNKSVPLAFLSREVRLAKCQIESLKVLSNSERREAMILHVIFRQLRTFQDNIYAALGNSIFGLAYGAFQIENSIYNTSQSPGASSLTVDLLANATSDNGPTLREKLQAVRDGDDS